MVAIGKNISVVAGVPIESKIAPIHDLDTVTLYLNTENQKYYYEYILAQHPRRVIFNPGAENPEFEKFARNAGGPLEVLRAPAAALDPAKEKLALERARLVTETRSSFLGLAVISTLMLFLFRIQNGKIILNR